MPKAKMDKVYALEQMDKIRSRKMYFTDYSCLSKFIEHKNDYLYKTSVIELEHDHPIMVNDLWSAKANDMFANMEKWEALCWIR